ncbi:hypothetical protein WA158_006022 [Blastocystis sp. Blastoise]
MSFQKAALYFLGTAAQSPNFLRNVTCTAFQELATGKCWLFDCGEGSQRQILYCNNKLQTLRSEKEDPFPNDIHLKNINKIFITHLHADHIYGLPPLLCTLNIVNTTPTKGGKQTLINNEPIEIYGPTGIYDFIATNIEITGTNINIPISIIELANGKDPQRSIQPKRLLRNFTYKQIYPNSNGFYDIFDSSLCTVQSGRISHGRSTSMGYVIKEKNTQGNIQIEAVQPILERNKNALLERGINCPEMLLKPLKMGKTIKLPDGSVLSPRDTSLLSPSIKGRTYTILGDTNNAKSLLPLCTGTDILIHESTIGPTVSDIFRSLSNPSFVSYFKRFETQLGRQWYIYKGVSTINELYNNKEKRNKIVDILSNGLFYDKYKEWAIDAGHSTAVMAGEFSNLCDAKQVYLNHISHRYITQTKDISKGVNIQDIVNIQNNMTCDVQDIEDIAKKFYGKNSLQITSDMQVELFTRTVSYRQKIKE